jgi:hypothetical protein
MFDADSHLTDESLLLEMEGELSPHAAKSVRAHLEACWKCRARRQELDGSIAEFVRAYQTERQAPLPPAAGPRELLKAQLSSLAAAGGNASARSYTSWIPLAGALSAAGLVLMTAVWIVAHTGAGALSGSLLVSTPDSVLTPGATVLLNQRAVCSQSNIKNKDVPAAIRRRVFEEYGIAHSPARAYEVDYLVTPALGGSDDIHNLWPHSYSTIWNARVKDALEDRMRDLVCGGQLDLSQAQREIAANWIDAYKKYFHTDRPLPEHSRTWP